MKNPEKRRSPRPKGSAPTPCVVPECGRPSKSKGLCGGHAWRLKTKGDVQAEKPIRSPQGVEECIVEGCSDRPQARGLCKPHWGKWRRHGDPLWTPSPKIRLRCSIPDCTGEVSAQGYCGKHYQRFRKYGDPLKIFQNERIESTGTCRIDGCKRPDVKQGLCSRHLNSFYRYGDPLVSKRRRRYADEIETICTVAGCRKPHAKRGYCGSHYQQMRVYLVKMRSTFAIRERSLKRIYESPCQACGSWENVSLDHVIPLARGGAHCEGNLQPLCMDCNRSKNDRLMIEWKYAKRLAESDAALTPGQKRSKGGGPRQAKRRGRTGNGRGTRSVAK